MKRRVLFVDDEQRVLDALLRMLHSQRGVWDMIGVTDPLEAWERLQDEKFDVVVSDINMPHMGGLELLQRMRDTDHLRELPVVMLTGLDNRELKRRALELGAADLLSKPVEPEDLVARLRSVLRLKSYQDELQAERAALEQRVRDRSIELYRSRLDVIWRLGKAAEHRDNETGNHVIRVGCMSRLVAEQMGMDREFLEALFVAAPLHDIGKIGVPDAILAKRGPLNDTEWNIMKQHCWIGSRILRDNTRASIAYGQWLGDCGDGDEIVYENPILSLAGSIALMHHEKWDGSGYPQQLSGEEIAMEARIVAVVDVFDALTSRRPYKEAYSEEEALEIIERTADGHFDRRVYAAFLEAFGNIRTVRQRFPDSVDGAVPKEEACCEADSVCR